MISPSDISALRSPGDGTHTKENHPRIFISYSRRDITEVDQLVPLLQARGVDVWIDRQDIPLTADFINAIQDGIAAADIVLAALTPSSIVSRMCQMELNTAHELGKRIVPVQLSPPSDNLNPPDYISRLNWIPYSPSGSAGTVDAVMEALCFDQEHLQTHTWLLMRARDWVRNGSRSSGLVSGLELKTALAWQKESATRQPEPTETQIQFIMASVRHEHRVRIVQASVGIVVTLAVVVAVWQARTSSERRLAADLESRAVQVATMLEGSNQTRALRLITETAQASLSHFGRVSPAIKGELMDALDRVREVGQYQDDQAQISSMAVNASTGEIVVAYRSGDENAGKEVAAGGVWTSLDAQNRHLLHTIAQLDDTYQVCHMGSCLIINNHGQIRSLIRLSGQVAISRSLLASVHASAADAPASGEWFLLGTTRGQVVRVNEKQGKLAVIAQLREAIRLVALNRSEQLALVNTESGRTAIVDITTGSVLRFPSLTLSPADPFAWGPDDASILTTGRPGEILRHEQGRREASLFARVGTQRISTIASSSDGTMVAAGSDTEGLVYVVRNDGNLLFGGGVFGGINPQIGFAPGGAILYTAGYLDRIVRFLDVKTEATLLWDLALGETIWKVSFCGRSGYLAWGDDNGRLGLVDSGTGRQIQSWATPSPLQTTPGRVEQLACLADLRTLSLHSDGQLREFDGHGHFVKSWQSAGPVVDFAGVSDQGFFAAEDKAVYKVSWDGTFRKFFEVTLDDAFRVAVDESQGRIAVGSSGSGYIEVHSLTDGRQLVPKYRAHLGLVMAMEYVPWNGLLASGGLLEPPT